MMGRWVTDKGWRDIEYMFKISSQKKSQEMKMLLDLNERLERLEETDRDINTLKQELKEEVSNIDDGLTSLETDVSNLDSVVDGLAGEVNELKDKE